MFSKKTGPTDAAQKTLITSAPRSSAFMISLGVIAPTTLATPLLRQALIISGLMPGLAMKRAPA